MKMNWRKSGGHEEARTMNEKQKIIDNEKIVFQKTSDPFISAGISGLIRYCKRRRDDKNDLCFIINGNSLTIESNELETVLREMYYDMGREYYDTSVQKSLDDKRAFYFDEAMQKIIQSKYKTFGYAYLINNSRQRQIGTRVRFGSGDPNVEKIIKEYLERNEVRITDDFEYFLNGRYTTVPELKPMKIGKGRKVCSICGGSNDWSTDTVSFSPFLGGASAGNNYVSMMKGTEKVCWSCLYLQRFSPVNAFYKLSGDLNVFIFNSDTIDGLENINSIVLKSLFYSKPQILAANYSRNYDDYQFGNEEAKDYFSHFSEQMYMILYSVYKKIELAKPRLVEKNTWLDFEEALYYKTEVFYLRAKNFGSTHRPVIAEKFTDIHYLFTLFKDIDKNKINLQYLLWALKLSVGDDRTVLRNRWAENVLHRKPTIQICETIVTKNFLNKSFKRDFRSILDWLNLYEPIINYGGNKAMDDETKDLAIKLGSQLGYAAKTSANPNVGKGKLIAIRKSRKLSQFLDLIISFQLRYKISINKEILSKINEKNFDYFRQFTLISALNSFNYNPK